VSWQNNDDQPDWLKDRVVDIDGNESLGTPKAKPKTPVKKMINGIHNLFSPLRKWKSDFSGPSASEGDQAPKSTRKWDTLQFSNSNPLNLWKSKQKQVQSSPLLSLSEQFDDEEETSMRPLNSGTISDSTETVKMQSVDSLQAIDNDKLRETRVEPEIYPEVTPNVPKVQSLSAGPNSSISIPQQQLKRNVYAPDLFEDETPGEFENDFGAQFQIRRFRREYEV
jgi:hypothetical protein